MPVPATLFSSQITEARYYCPEKTVVGPGPEIRCVGWEQCRPDYAVARTTFPWWAIELVVQGAGWVEFSQGRFPLRTGSLFGYGPGLPHRIVTDAERPLRKYFLDFTGSHARKILTDGNLPPGEVRHAFYPQEMQELLERIIQEGNRNTASSRKITQHYLQIFFHKLSDCAPEKKGHLPFRTLETYLRAHRYLEKNFVRLSQLEEVARELHLSPETLCRCFQQYNSLSPYQYLLRLKMNLAVDLLLSTPLLVKEVGQRIGMEDPLHFSRLFKKNKGLSPEKFRLLHQRSAGAGSPP